jgi:hypothetical protein
MAKLYIMNRVLTNRIQSHTKSCGLLNDSEDDLHSLRETSLAPLPKRKRESILGREWNVVCALFAYTAV